MEPKHEQQQLHLPAGFRFHPTDEELVVSYLAHKAESRPFPIPIVAEVDLYKYDPWELPDKAYFGEREWYFFSPRDRKYPNGARPNRAAASGYWKATGTDKPIQSKSKKVGVKKALVFYKGKAPKGVKTNWIMHEYRLAESKVPLQPARKKGSLRLDDWVLCRIYKKTSGVFKAMVAIPPATKSEPRDEAEFDDVLASLPDIDNIDNPKSNSPYSSAPSFMTSSSSEQPPATSMSMGDLMSSHELSENGSGSYYGGPGAGSGYYQPSTANLFAPDNMNSWAYDGNFSASPFTRLSNMNPPPFLTPPVAPVKLELDRAPSNINEILAQIQNQKKRSRLHLGQEEDCQSTCRSPAPRPPRQGFGFVDLQQPIQF